ncbi:aminopeptidase N [Candidatus Tenderia electrophaga]|jgi:aminopeptidase N|uniref:Aminopeptidase N n=1 Tax=Candidatus Tenderia electrophaga TaxID=1748243 RepID=A0A0S2TDB2_9GAMM|nr:aminopeptidase N [Candidatus Tenderia electrophaga]
MNQHTPETVYLKDYHPTPFSVDAIKLHVNLGEEQTVVTSNLTLQRRGDGTHPLRLDGQDLELLRIELNGKQLSDAEYEIGAESLTLMLDLPDRFELEIQTAIQPHLNTSLEGLYQSSGNFCTQCEAEGFRKITYFYDRPDVMTLFTTTIEADKEKYPVLLSNGNAVARGELGKGRHWVTWEDPFKKPSYLFALVAGRLACIEDNFTTKSGREVTLQIFVEAHNADKCDHAMASLKRAMKWDEEVFGREYDLDIYMIVAVDDFNMGAMENKGLNVFNSKYVLARQDTATDTDFVNIESVIGHEYFHNWSGNRVTCRDWFQLSLKEGFTVFRDQQFTADMFSATVKRIDDVNRLRSYQFIEDAGPMAHPVRPESYVEINNFYTLTVYEKGAEVVRMIYNLLGREAFRKGTDLYFERHDGQAVTTDDFVQAMEDVSGIDLAQFKRWYSQAGTPVLACESAYDADAKTFTLKVEQSCPPTPGQEVKELFHIPLTVGLLDPTGRPVPLKLQGEAALGQDAVLHVKQAQERFVFTDVAQRPVPSLLRHFSAPVKLRHDYRVDELAFLMSKDTDEFNRWDAGQRLGLRLILQLVEQLQRGEQADSGKLVEVYGPYSAAFASLLQEQGGDLNFRAAALQLPSENYIGASMAVIDPGAIFEARWALRRALAREHEALLWQVFGRNAEDGEFYIDAAAIGRRALKNSCLAYLATLEDEQVIHTAQAQAGNANNMTDVMAALRNLMDIDCPERLEAIDRFYGKWQDDALVVDKWLTLQAVSRLPDTLDHVKGLMQHAAFSIKNPNKVRALIGGFVSGNAYRFHQADGAGYAFLADQVTMLDRLNPQVAARLVAPLIQWRRYDQRRQVLMQQELHRIMAEPELSKDVFEVVSKGLA